jgi:plasmid stability protein
MNKCAHLLQTATKEGTVRTKEAIAMPILHVRGVPQDLYDRIKLRAAAEHRSLSAEVINLLERGLNAPGRPFSANEWLEDARRFRQEMEAKYGPYDGPSSAELIREDRDSR